MWQQDLEVLMGFCLLINMVICARSSERGSLKQQFTGVVENRIYL